MTFRPDTSLAMKRAYAVIWDDGAEVTSGRLEFLADRLEFHGRARHVALPFSDVRTASIVREHDHRLRGLPALTVRLRSGAVVRIATLEGAGVLHELAAHVHAAGLDVVA
jgi:hypothetical protein